MSAVEKCVAEQAAGLRALAEMIEAVPELAVPLELHFKYQAKHVSSENAGDVLAMFARAALKHGAKVEKTFLGGHASVVASWNASFAFKLQTEREQVCERVVTGKQVVTKTVKDPELLAEVPEIEVAEEVEVVEWRCRPLLASHAGGDGS